MQLWFGTPRKHLSSSLYEGKYLEETIYASPRQYEKIAAKIKRGIVATYRAKQRTADL